MDFALNAGVFPAKLMLSGNQWPKKVMRPGVKKFPALTNSGSFLLIFATLKKPVQDVGRGAVLPFVQYENVPVSVKLIFVSFVRIIPANVLRHLQRVIQL